MKYSESLQILTVLHVFKVYFSYQSVLAFHQSLSSRCTCLSCFVLFFFGNLKLDSTLVLGSESSNILLGQMGQF